MNINGYETFTTFWQDFTIADAFGTKAVQDTYDRAFAEWKNDYKYLTELVMILNHKCWQHYYKGNDALSDVYADLYYKTHHYALDTLKGDKFKYYFDITD